MVKNIFTILTLIAFAIAVFKLAFANSGSFSFNKVRISFR